MKSRKYIGILSSNFAEYFLYFIALSVLLTVLLGGSLYYYSSSYLKKEAITNNSNSLTLLRNAQELVLSEVDKSMGNIFLDSFYASYMDYYYRQDMVTLQNLQRKLDDVILTNNYIESVYIYYHRDRFVLSSKQGPLPIEEFQDKGFAEQLVNKKFEKNYVRTRMLPTGVQGDESIVTIVKAIPIYYFTDLPTAYVVINIKGFYLQQMIDSIKTNQDAAIMVVDGTGNIITKKAGTNDGVRNVAEYLALPETTTSGTVEKKIDGVDTLVSYVNSQKYGWTYVYTIPMSVISYKVQAWLKTALLVTLSVMLLGLLLSLMLSKRIFAPLKRMLSLLKSGVPDEDGNGPKTSLKEMKQIERNVNRILDHNRKLELQMGEYEVYSKKKFLGSLLSSETEISPKTSEKLLYYGLNLDEAGHYTVCLLSMDEYAKFSNGNSEKVRNTVFLQINEAVAEYVLRHQEGFIAEADANQVVLVLNFGEPVSSDEARARSYGIAKNLQAHIGETFPYTFTMGVSMPHQGIGSIHECFYEATAAAEYRMILGNGGVILYESMERGDKHIAYPMAIERSVLSALKMGNAQELDRSFEEFRSYIQSHATEHIEIVRSFYLQLFSSTIKCIYEMDSDFELGSLRPNVSHTDLLLEETMQGMAAYLVRVYEQILFYLGTKRSMKNKELINEIQEYITNNVKEDLTLERLGEIFYISSSYLRKIFKDETGGTIKEFVMSERMRVAKELLEHSPMKIAEIAEQVGYMSAQSFAKVFKLEIGRTPAEFREERHRAGRQG